jgi:hypothetical protein
VIGLMSEASITIFTLKRFLARVNSNMILEFATLRESSTTVLTDMLANIQMRKVNVIFERIFSAKTFVRTILAKESNLFDVTRFYVTEKERSELKAMTA